jgi:hypothetical protein
MKPTIPEVTPLVLRYYEDHPVGGNLHIVLDDGNIKDGHVQYCLDSAHEQGDSAGVELATLLLKMSLRQRWRLYCMDKRRLERKISVLRKKA